MATSQNTTSRTINRVASSKLLLLAAAVVFGIIGVYIISRSNAATGVVAGPETQENIAYANTHSAQKLDLMLPERTGTPVPLVIDIHGGAFSGGDKSGESYNYDALLNEGWAVASLNYRLSGDAQFPAGGQDVKAAVRWLRANADTYGIDPDRFAAWGRSAGGYMVAMLGVTGDQPTVFDDDSLGNPNVSDAVQAVVGYYSPTNFATMDTQARQTCGSGNYQVHDADGSPESYWLRAPVQESPLTSKADLTSYVATNPKLPKFALYHGSWDCTVPPGQSQELADALTAAGNTPDLRIVDGFGHADDRFDRQMIEPGIELIKSAFAEVQTPVTPGDNANDTTPEPCVALPSGAPTATASINIPADGTYRIWSRIKSTNGNTTSYGLQLSPYVCNAVVGGNSSLATNNWEWIDYRDGSEATKLEAQLKAGTYDVILTSNQPGIAIDKLIFTTDTTCKPTGLGENCGTSTTQPEPNDPPGDNGSGNGGNSSSSDLAINSFTASAENITQGQTTTLSWETANATSCTVEPGAGTVVVPNGSWTTPALNTPGTSTFVLSCEGANNTTATESVNIKIAATSSTPQPVINSFTANPTNVPYGQSSTLEWKTSNVAVSGCAISPSPLTSASANGTWTTPALTESVTYTLTCVNSEGSTTTKNLGIAVTPVTTVPGDTETENPPPPVNPDTPTRRPSGSNQTDRSTVTASDGTEVSNAATSSTVSGETTLDNTNVINSQKEKTIVRTEYYENGGLVYSDTEAPFTLDTTQLRDGTHTITERTYYEDGSSSELTNTITVANATELPNTGTSSTAIWGSLFVITLLAACAGGFIIWIKRTRNNSDYYQSYDAGAVPPAQAGSYYTPAPHNDGADWQQDLRSPDEKL
ncbi:hypothetical protein CR970_02180 [Candidatus Saccharibacteria bacterium]|nr:MAG: hypothetical protein CR970_02180 [Candidatus Saccharibacteria bacterium]